MQLSRSVAISLACVIFTAAGLGQASPPAGDVEIQVKQIFKLDGTADLFEIQLEAREASLGSEASKTPAWEIEWARQWTRLMFQQPEYEADYTRAFIEAFEAGHAQATLRWLESPITARLNRLKAELGEPGGLEKLNEFLRSPERQFMEPEREAMLIQYSEASRCPEHNISLIVDTRLARESAANQRLPEAERKTSDELRTIAADLPPRYREGVSRGCWIPLIFAFRDVSDDDLDSYLTFIQSDAGQWYTEAHHRATRSAWVSGGRRVAAAGLLSGQNR